MNDIKLIAWSQETFLSGSTCLVGMNLLFGTRGVYKGECWGDETFFFESYTKVLIHASPTLK